MLAHQFRCRRSILIGINLFRFPKVEGHVADRISEQCAGNELPFR